MLNPARDDVIFGLTCDGCCNGARENVIASVPQSHRTCWTQRQNLRRNTPGRRPALVFGLCQTRWVCWCLGRMASFDGLADE